ARADPADRGESAAQAAPPVALGKAQELPRRRGLSGQGSRGAGRRPPCGGRCNSIRSSNYSDLIRGPALTRQRRRSVFLPLMPGNVRFTRTLAVIRIQRQLERDSFPRIQMTLIVGLTGAAGLLCSFLLLHAGVGHMAVRYPLALVGAYTCFLFLIWLW